MDIPKFPDVLNYSEVVQYVEFVVRHIVAGPITASHVVAPLLLFSLLIPPSILTTSQLRSLVLPLSFACFIYTLHHDHTFDVVQFDVNLWTFVLVGFYDPRRDFKLLHLRETSAPVSVADGPLNRQDGISTSRDVVPTKSQSATDSPQVTIAWEESYPPTFPERLRWTVNLMMSVRLNGWKIGEKNRDARQPRPRIPRNVYLRDIVIGMIRGYLLCDAASFLARNDTYFQTTSISIFDVSAHPLGQRYSSVLAKWGMVILRITVIEAQINGAVSLYTFNSLMLLAWLAALIVPVGPEWYPWNNPPIFGPFSSIWNEGIRGFWGKWWHQMVREISTPPGRFVADILRLDSKSPVRYALLAASAFFISGVLHAGIIPAQPIFATVGPMNIRFLMAGFFWAQFPGVMIEIVVAFLARKYLSESFLSSTFRKVITFTWVWSWCAITFPLIGEATRQLGYWKIHSVPFSPLNGVLNGRWLMWY